MVKNFGGYLAVGKPTYLIKRVKRRFASDLKRIYGQVWHAPTVIDEFESPLRRMIWVFPDRESQRGVSKWQRTFWLEYAQVAEELGLRWSSHAPDDVAVDCSDFGHPIVTVAGEPVTPEDTLFITSLYSLPYQAQDVFNQYALYAVLEQLGFHLPSPPYLSAIVNDKLATLLHLGDSPIPPIPTVRLGTGRDLGHKFYERAVEKLTFPAIVKPTGWCSGWGICLAHNVEDLRGLLSLAQGGETTLVCQPYLGSQTSDYRIYLVDGEPVCALRRTPRKGGYVGNLGRGGMEDYVDLPAELTEALAHIAKRVPIPYLCVDFLHDGQRFWLSEIEPDGVISSPDKNSADDEAITKALMRARWEAYRRGHTQWLARP
jgi:glutathione synthase/RimK-type ligase-like ATP-grasp enzyme